MKTFALCAFALLSSFLVAAKTDAPLPAKEVFAKAQAEAKRTHKAVFVGFHASWCGWCKRMESVLVRPEVKAIWEKHFVPVWLVVQESEDKKSLENKGAEDLMKLNGGDKAGIPYFFFTDSKGKTLVTSMQPGTYENKGSNIGCPYEPMEVAFFMSMLSKAAPKMTDAERSTIKTAFESLKKADGKTRG